MSIRCFPPQVRSERIEDHIDLVFNGSALIVAVEVFDHPESRYRDEYGCVTGPWVVGPEDEVYAFCEAQGWEDFTVQHSSPDPAFTVEVTLPTGTTFRWEAHYSEGDADNLYHAIVNLLGDPTSQTP